MGIFNFLGKPKKDTNEEIKKANAQPNMITIDRENGTETDVFQAQIAKKFIHRDGSISCLVTAKVLDKNVKSMIILSLARPVCFEIPEGRMDLVRKVVEKNCIMDLKSDSYTYLGRAYDDEDIRLQQPTATVNDEIKKLDQILLEELAQKREEQARREEENKRASLIRQEESLKATMEHIDEKKRYEESIKQERCAHPYIKGTMNGPFGEEYDGVNITNGEILKVRNIKKIGKDATGTYVYTARIKSTPNEYDFEAFNPEIGIPVVFSTPFRLSDIVNSEYSKNYKAKLERGLLQMLSLGYQRNLTTDGNYDTSNLHDIGGINKSGELIPNDEKHVSNVIINKIETLQEQYASQDLER